MAVSWGEIAVHGSVLAALAPLAWGTFVPQSRLWGPVVWRGSAAAPPRVALTFDDGPHPEASPRILDELAGLGAKAAFFLIGASVERHPQVVRRIHDEGHLIGNHTFDHPAFGLLRGPRYWRRQIERTENVIADVVGVRPAMFRPPVGIKTWFSAREARRLAVVTWTRRAFDGVTTTPQRIVARLSVSRAGEILLLHDGVSPQSRRDPAATIAAVRPLVLELRNHGIEPVRLDELTGLPAYAGRREC